MFRRFVHLLTLLSLITTCFGQQPANPEMGPAEVKDLVRRAGLGMKEYRNKFKDVTAEEEQTAEEFDAQGKLTKQRRIASDLVIYQSQLDPNVMVEYRDVKAVDGVPVKKREARLMSLLAKSAKADSLKKEIDRIDKESRRYDLKSNFYGMTLNQGLPLEENLREAFQFTFAGREQVSGRDAIVVDYQQVSQTPSLKSDLKALPSPLNRAEAFHRGRLWLDAETAQIRREVREMTLQLPSLKPLIFYRFELDYADSRFGFLTPRRLVISFFNRGHTGPDKIPVLQVGAKVTFEYGAFSRFDVETPDASLDPPAKP